MPKNPYNLTPSTLKGQGVVLTGDVIFVDSATGGASGDGSSLRPFSTIENALNKSGLSSGDTIYVAQGHTETLSTATALNLDTAGVSIIGLGFGSQRPVITLDTATTTTIPVTAANVLVRNIIFSANYADIVAVFTSVAAKNFTLDNCYFKATAANMNFLNILDTGTTTADMDGLTVTNCKWIEPDLATLGMIKCDGTFADWNISRNQLHLGVNDNKASLIAIATGKILTNLMCADNLCYRLQTHTATGALFISTDGTTNSGFFLRNYGQTADAAGDILITANSGLANFDSKMAGVATASAYLNPVVDS
jgi:hypothetical protein